MDAISEQMVIEELRYIRKSLDEMKHNGCAKAGVHERIATDQNEIFSRLRVVENAQAEGRGKLAVFAVLFGAVLSIALQWIGKHV